MIDWFSYIAGLVTLPCFIGIWAVLEGIRKVWHETRNKRVKQPDWTPRKRD